MKLINLIPDSIKTERQQKQFKKIALGSTIIPIGLYVKMTLSISGIEDDITLYNQQLSEAASLEGEINHKESSLFNDMRIVNVLSRDNFPLHRFLLFSSLDIPDDMRLYSVTSESFIQNQIQEEKEKEAEKENPKGSTQPLEEIDTLEEGENPKSDEEKEKEEQEKIEQTYNQQKTLYIRGATISVESIGKFMQDLEDNDFVEKVKIQHIQNYYNGAHSYKIFELIVQTK